MKIMKINDEADYQRALNRVEQLFGSIIKTSKENEELDNLVNAVVEYESLNHVVDSPTEEDIIEFLKDQQIRTES